MAVSGWRRWTCLALISGVLAVALAGCVGGGGGGGEQGWLFHVTDLGTLGGDMSTALAVNDSGHVVGWSRLEGTDTHHAFRYVGGSMRDLGTLSGGGSSTAAGINRDGVICGTSAVGEPNQRAFRYANNRMDDIGTVSPSVSANAEGINNAGQIVGNSGNAAFLWTNGQMAPLPTPGGAGGATASNRSAMVCGWCWLTGASTTHAFRGTLASATDLGAMGGESSQALDITDDGECVGYYVEGANKRLFIYRNNAMENIGTLGGAQGEAHGISNAGIVVGTDWTAQQYTHAFLWDGTMHDLNDLLDVASRGWTLTRANDINESNVIVGQGRAPNGEYHAFIARPVG